MRVLLTETLDPDGALARWASPDLLALGHEVLPLPTQEVAPILGAHGLGAWIVALCESWRPDLVLVCPPYDHVPLSTWAACRAHGARVVGFAMDEPLFTPARARPAVAAVYDAVVRAFDRLYVTAPDAAAALAARGLSARWLRWALSAESYRVDPAALEPLDPAVVSRLGHSAVLVGRPYARRVALVQALAERVPLMLFGHGWESLDLGRASAHGPLEGPAMRAVLARAGVVVTTGDWESLPIAMVKARLLEAAFCGAAQVAQDAPDVRAYFTADEVPVYRDEGELAAACERFLADPRAARQAADKSRARALREHTWAVRWSELAGDLGLLSPPAGPTSPARLPPAWIAVVAAAAADAERRRAMRLAATLHRASGDRMGEARCLLSLDAGASLRAAEAALAAREADPGATVGLYQRLPTPAPALGLAGLLDPTPELEAIRITALLRAGDTAGAQAAVEALIARGDPDRLVATATLLAPDTEPRHQELWRMLFDAARAATPADPVLGERLRS
jgi:hypothetical protein